MAEAGAPEPMREALKYWVVEARGPGNADRVREYDLEYRKQIEEDIAEASVDYIRKQVKRDSPFFLMIGWTRPHFPNDVDEQFAGASGTGKYGDSVLELDYRTGQVLDAIEEAGIEDDTIVIFVSDNGPTTTGGSLDELYAGDPGPFRGELGDAYEGSIRTVGMVRWPGKIRQTVTNEMFAIHDFLPTLASIIGADVPDDRPFDGVDQSAFLLGQVPGMSGRFGRRPVTRRSITLRRTPKNSSMSPTRTAGSWPSICGSSHSIGRPYKTTRTRQPRILRIFAKPGCSSRRI